MNIACFGCSYTAGMPDNDWYNWPETLAKLRSSDKIYNLAVGGSSLLLSLYLLEEFSKLIKFDKVLFQITHPHRFSSINNLDIRQLQLSNKQNYYRLDPEIRKQGNIVTITPSNSKMQWSNVYEKIKFAKQYYRYYNADLGMLEHNILKNVVKEKSNLSFEYSEIPKEAKEHIIDNAGHFNKDGHDIIARWINNELERNIY